MKPETAILTVSFGTSHESTRKAAIGGIEQAIREKFPDFVVRRAFTSQKIISILNDQYGLKVDTVSEAMERLCREGTRTLLIQPTHIIPGIEYEKMKFMAAPFTDSFDKVLFGKPLLGCENDLDQVADILSEAAAEYDDARTAVVFMGHGTDHSANQYYERMERQLLDRGHEKYFIGTVEAFPGIDHVLSKLKRFHLDHVVLIPFMIVAGDHACHDMAGDEETSWKRILETEGYGVTCVLRGLGEYPRIQALFADHAKQALISQECGFGVCKND